MWQFAIYLVLAVITFRVGYWAYYDKKDSYTSDGEFQFFWLCAGLLWFIFLPCFCVWQLATLGRPKSPKMKQAEREAKLAAVEKQIFRRKVELADLEHDNGYVPADPPKGWVPKGHSSRYYNVEAKLS